MSLILLTFFSHNILFLFCEQEKLVSKDLRTDPLTGSQSRSWHTVKTTSKTRQAHTINLRTLTSHFTLNSAHRDITRSL
ncbi:hypothetical protein J6590_007596 [Homalodisca vitripennis]|nr:hypothetical protein J6590_007596 [Homalodisca vitripennis]